MKNFSAIMNRIQESFRYENDWEYEAKDRFEEAKAIAETLTTLDMEFSHICQDVNTSYEVGGSEELELSWLALNKEKGLFINILLDGEKNE